MYFNHTPEKGENTESCRAKVIAKAHEYVLNPGVGCEPASTIEGCSVEDAAKVIRAFHAAPGETPAPMLLRTPDLWLGHVNSMADQYGILLDRLTGSLTIDETTERAEQRIALRPEGAQNLFVCGVKRFGQVDATIKLKPGEPPPFFWSWNLLCCETTGELPLVVGLEVNREDNLLDCQFSRQLYRRRVEDPQTHQIRTIDRLRHLKGTANLPAALLLVMQAYGFPLETTRKNRPSREERAANGNSRNQRVPTLVAAPSYVTAGSAPAEGEGSTPFSEE
jgi:hypothetical protein